MLTTAALLVATPAGASEDLVSGLSQDTVEITSNYTGTDIVVFGAIERPEEVGSNDIVVVVRGPTADMTVRQKEWVAGIWINHDQAKLVAMPTFYYLASTRTLDHIAPAFTLERYALGLDNIAPTRIVSHHDPEPFRQALIRHKQAEGVYGEVPGGVELLSPTLFRARIPVAATVTPGQYNVDVYLLRDGTVISAQSTPLYIQQTGLERRLYNLAHVEPLWYGVLTVLMASLLGWLSAAAFRRNE
ncbi:MAG TPA: TIGR02186 family protein [Rhizomicrobium sp.]|nr:TIGR02186 family protein [Rhizomicrobium sp.]